MDIKKLIERYPRIYHMAEKGTWPSIRDRGLLSASAALDLFGINGANRRILEAEQRRQKIDLVPNSPDSIVLRDQKPMPEERLLRALKGGVTPEQWYQSINEKVFFWAQEERLHVLLNAREYKTLEHDVITIDATRFIPAYAQKIWLCHMNSGNTWPMPHPRDQHTFCRIPEYPAKRSGAPAKEVVEITVDYHVPDIEDYALEVWRMIGSEQLYRLA